MRLTLEAKKNHYIIKYCYQNLDFNRCYAHTPSPGAKAEPTYAPQTKLCTIVVSTKPTHPKHSNITDLCAMATPPILHRSRYPREKRQRPSNGFDVSDPRPLPSVVRYWLKSKAGVSNHRRRPRLIQTYKSKISDPYV